MTKQKRRLGEERIGDAALGCELDWKRGNTTSNRGLRKEELDCVRKMQSGFGCAEFKPKNKLKI